MKHSPFAFFRKHQRVGMVILTVMAMFAFVFMDSLTKGGGGGTHTSKVAVKIKGGNLTDVALYNLKIQRGVINDFIARVIVAISTAEEENKRSDQQINQAVRMNQFGIEWPGEPESDANVIWGHIMRLEAGRLGLVVTDPMIDSHIKRMTENKLTAEQFRSTLRSMDLREKQLYDMFRDELLARNAWLITRPMIDHTPEHYWHYYRQMKVRQNLEVAALPVSEFAKSIKDPSDAVLTAFFDQHKNRFAGQGPDYATPGFRQPNKAAVQYLTASYEDIEKTVPAITDAEVTEYYEKNKNSLYREFEKPSTTSENDPLNPELAPERPAEPAQPEDAKPAEKAPTEKPAEKSPTETSEVKPGEEKPVDKKPEEEKKPEVEKKPGEEVKESEKPCQDESTTEKSETTTKAEDKAESDKPAAEKPAADKSDTEKAAPAKSENDKPASKPAETKPAETKSTDAKATDTKTTDANAPAGTEGKPEAEPIRYQPLTETLKENIREQLLVTRTTEAIKKKGAEAVKMLDGRNLKYNLPPSVNGNVAYIDFNENGEMDSDEPFVESKTKLNPEETDKIPAEVTTELKNKILKLAAADLQAVGKKLGMKYSSIDLLSAKEIDEMPGLGKVIDEGDNPFQPNGAGRILNVLFGREQLFSAELGQDSEEKDLYVYWKSDFVKSHIPKLDEPGIKKLVVDAWKQQQAYPAAAKRAEELAKLVGPQKLEVALKGQTVDNSKDGLPVLVHETADFSWMTPATPSPNMWETQPPTLSTVAFVKDADEEFMQVACEDLGIGESGFAPNRDHSIVYVMRVINREPKPGEETERMRETFMKERLFGIIPGVLPSAYSHIASQDDVKLAYNWMEGLRKMYDVSFTDEEMNF